MHDDQSLSYSDNTALFFSFKMVVEYTMTVEVQIIVSSDSRVNGMLLQDTRPKSESTHNTAKASQSDSSCSGGPSATQELKSTGIAEVILGVNRDGFVDLFIELLSSMP